MNGMNGSGRPKDPIAAALAARAPQAQQVDPMQFFAQFFGLSVPTLRAMQPNVVPCMCGRCRGVGVQLEVRLHFPLMGPPEFITRGDAVKMENVSGAAQAAETGKEKP